MIQVGSYSDQSIMHFQHIISHYFGGEIEASVVYVETTSGIDRLFATAQIRFSPQRAGLINLREQEIEGRER